MKASFRIVWVVPALILALCVFAGCSKPKQNALTQTKPSGGGIVSKLTGGADLKALAQKRKSLSSYTMKMVSDEKPISFSVKLNNGELVKMKMETGEGSLMIVDTTQKATFMYDAKTKTAMKIPQNESPDEIAKKSAPGMPKMPDIDEVESKHEKLGSEKIDGVDCWVISFPAIGESPVQAWIDKEWGLPRQEKIGDKIIKFEFSEINSVPDSAFELPAGTKVQDMSEMMKGAGKMPGAPGN